MPKIRQLTTGQRMLVAGAVAVILCTLIVLGSTTERYMQITMRRGEVADFFEIAAWSAVWWSGWALLTPFVFELGWRVRLLRERWAPPLLILFGGLIVAFSIHVAIQVASMALPGYSDIHPDLADAIAYHALISFYLDIFIYCIIIVVANAIRVHRATQIQALKASELEAELTQARLDSLKMQLHPHFLFNTLNGISSLMYRDVELADTMVTRLSRLLRRALDRADAHELTLGEEIDLLREYLSIEQLRFGEKLRVGFDVEDGTAQLLVPSFVYQPLVENSIKHAVRPQGNAGTITIGAHIDSGRLKLRVADDGPGLEPGEDLAFTGVGLSNLYDRLDRLYGDGFSLDIRNVEPKGLAVEVTIPARPSSLKTAGQPSAARFVTQSNP